MNNKVTFQALFVFLLSALFYLYEFIIQVSPAIMVNDLMQIFSVNATKLGILSSCFFYSYTLMQFPAGLIFDKYNIRFTLCTVILICSGGVLLFALSNNIYAAAIARFIIGGASAFAFTGTLHLIITWLPPRFFAFFAGLTEMLGSIGAIIGTVPLAYLIHKFGWRIGLIYFSGFGVLLAILVLVMIKGKKNTVTNLDETPASVYKRKFNLKRNLQTVFKNQQTWVIGIYSFTIWAPILGFSALWAVPFLEIKYKLTLMQAAHAIFFAWLGVAIGSPLIGWVSDIIKRRCILQTICALIGMLALFMLVYWHNINHLIANFLLFMIGFGSAGQTISFALIRDNNPYFTAGTANGFNNMVVVAGGILFQPLIGKILDFSWHGLMCNGVRSYDIHSYQIAFLSLIICYLIALIISIFFIKESYGKPLYCLTNKILP